jgi:hypothetical protein
MVYFFSGYADSHTRPTYDSRSLNRGKPTVAKTKTAKRTTKIKQKSVGDTEVTVCRRRGDRRQTSEIVAKGARAVAASEESPSKTVAPVVPIERRAKVQRRRQIDPTTCERDYTSDEIEFMHALDAYKRSSGRMFPTCSEILEVVRSLGYIRAEHGGVI